MKHLFHIFQPISYNSVFYSKQFSFFGTVQFNSTLVMFSSIFLNSPPNMLHSRTKSIKKRIEINRAHAISIRYVYHYCTRMLVKWLVINNNGHLLSMGIKSSSTKLTWLALLFYHSIQLLNSGKQQLQIRC